MGEPVQIGRYVLHDQIAAGGMATIHLGRASGALGFARSVAIKRILPQFRGEQDFVDMFIDETRVAARIQHPNVVSTLDVVVTDEEVFLVMEHVLGASLARLLRESHKLHEHVPIPIAVAIACGSLRGLDAAHEVRSENGEPLGVVHRDVSPQNVLVGVDGIPRIIDFGVAKAEGRLMTTRSAQLKGKLAYMAPEQLRGIEPDRRSDVYSLAVILWEAVTGRRLFTGDNDSLVYAQVLNAPIDPPRRFTPSISRALDEIIMRGLARDPDQRWSTAHDMLVALEATESLASPTAIGAWVRQLDGPNIEARAARIAELERGATDAAPTSRRLFVDPTPSATGSKSVRLVAEPPSETSVTGFGRSIDVDIEPASWWTRKRALGAGTAAAALLVVGILLGTHFGGGPAPAAATIPPASAQTLADPAPHATVESHEDESLVAPPSTAADPSSSDAPASDSPPAATPPAATPPVATPRPAAVQHVAPPVIHKPPVPPPAAKPTCDPPWVLDAKGIKRFKPECL